MQGSVTLISGCPASGKTTLGKRLSNQSDKHLHLQTDLFFEALTDLIDPSTPESRQQNENIVRQYSHVANGFRLDGYHVLLDGVIGPWMLPIVSDFIDEFHYAILHPELNIVLGRGAARTTKYVSPEAIAHMHGEFATHRAGFEPWYFEDGDRIRACEQIPLCDGPT